MSRKRVWFNEMDNIIRENQDKTDKELVDLLGNTVTESAVKKRRQSLGIRHKRGRRAAAATPNEGKNIAAADSGAIESGAV